MLIEPCNLTEQKARIFVLGVGGGGGNALNRMIEEGMSSVDFIAINTDAQDLEYNNSQTKLQIGKELTGGLGAGADSEIGRKAVEENKEIISKTIVPADMIFITAGMGGGTGSGAGPAIAKIAKDMGKLTVGVVTKPFLFEGPIRKKRAIKAIEELKKSCDTLLVIPNEILLNITDSKTTVQNSFKLADTVLLQATKGISDLINVPGLINLDFADVKKIMQNMGDAVMGTGIATGEERALLATQQAINSPLLQDQSISGAKGCLVNITSSAELGIHELNEASKLIYEEAGDKAEVILGFTIDDTLNDEIRVTVIATGLDSNDMPTADSVPKYNALEDQRPRFMPQNLFDNEEDKNETSSSSATINHTELENNEENVSEEVKQENESLTFGDNDFDVPAYIRNNQNN